MALDPIVWALKDAPVKDAGERLILTILAEHSDEDGTSAYPSQKTIAGYAMLTDRSVRDKLKALEERGLVVRGDQRLVAHFAADKRPVVWDLAIPFTWWGVRWDRMNRSRTTKGLRALAPEERPDIAAVDGKGSNAQAHKPQSGATGTQFRPEAGSGRNVVPQRPELSSGGDRNQVPTTLPMYPPQDPPHSLADSVDEERDLAGVQALVVEAPVAKVTATVEDDFDRFWKAWPKRVAKPQAVKAFRAATRTTDAETIIAAAAAIRDHRLCPKPDDARMRFVPYPATWLNAAGWADEYPLTRRWEDDEADQRGRGGRPNGFVVASEEDQAAYAATLEKAWGTDAPQGGEPQW